MGQLNRACGSGAPVFRIALCALQTAIVLYFYIPFIKPASSVLAAL